MSTRSTSKFATVVAVAAASLTAVSANAELITFTFTGNAYFVFDQTSNTTANYTIVATGDTDDRFLVNGGGATAWVIPNSSATLTIDGWGTEQLLNPTSTAWNIPYRAAGLVSSDLSQLAISTSYEVLPEWDMLSSVSTAVTEGGTGNMWLGTSRGLVLLNISHSVSFSAVVGTVPAPGAIALLGLAGLAKRRRR